MPNGCIDLESGVGGTGQSELSSTMTFWLPPALVEVAAVMHNRQGVLQWTARSYI